MEDLICTLVQANLVWENPKANCEKLETMIAQAQPETDVVVLPEMFNTGFSMNPETLAEPPEGETFQWMRNLANQLNAAVTGSVITVEGRHYYNRLYWVFPNGEHRTYDKRHLFSLANEGAHYTAGKEQLHIAYKGWLICPMICYDLRFPVWSRNNESYDLAIYVANWPERRSFPWSQLLIARAIENQAYVIGVNRVGEDGNGVNHSGDSVALDPLGHSVVEMEPGIENVRTITLSSAHLMEVREKFQFLNDRDKFTIHSE